MYKKTLALAVVLAVAPASALADTVLVFMPVDNSGMPTVKVSMLLLLT